MNKVKQLNSVDEWNKALELSDEQPVFIFKHSTRCPVSADAYDQYGAYLNRSANEDVAYFLVLVVEYRPVSNAIAESLELKHESPQAILIHKRKPVWHTSHWRITESNLKDNLARSV
ncbi:bacillithiol system redox-active protein YtxJ [Paenibacillus senegalensis]|uniref:bacillithiol system redox-active protein YtxJ n=1 Tax=Paenibacillus senegalensis TaxID=1465766 RepID=UPI0002892537|nr:bacillithiol system redox-active protein YtxJ [Paenibacillus senegalensis]